MGSYMDLLEILPHSTLSQGVISWPLEVGTSIREISRDSKVKGLDPLIF